MPAGPVFDQVRLYQQFGLLARGAPMPFVGNVSFLAASTPDSTHMILGVGISNSSLTFARENDRFRAGYTIELALRMGGITIKQAESHESVLITSFRETGRIDESVIYQEVLTLKPGRYNLTLTVRDDGSSRSSTEDVTLQVPSLAEGSLATPIAFARVSTRLSPDSLPRIVTSPTATMTFGRDTTVPLYIEAYGRDEGSRLPLRYSVYSDSGRLVYSDTASVQRRTGLYSGVVLIPVARIGIGPAMIAFTRAARPDTGKVPVFVGFGEDLPVASYEEMISYLRWFAPSYQLKALKDTAPEFRPGAWAKFIRERGGNGGTEALRDYFMRMLTANARFREEGIPGWLTDRGKVLLGLGEADQAFEQRLQDMNQRGRTQIWEYRSMNLTLTFYDQTGFGRWRLTNSSEAEFQAAWRRRTQQ